MRRAQDQSLELPLVTHVDRVDRRAGHLGPRLDPRRALCIAVVAAGAGVGDGAQDVVVRAASAEMAGERGPDLLAGRRPRAARRAPGIVEGRRFDDEAWGAKPALQGVERHEGALNGMQLARADSFDGGDRLASDGLGGQKAAHDRRAVDQHRAGAANARAADELGSREPQVIAQNIDQQRLGIVRQRRRTAVDEGSGSWASPSGFGLVRLRRLGDRPANEQANGSFEIGEAAFIRLLETDAARGEFDAARKLGWRHAVPQDEPVRGADARDCFGDHVGFLLG